MENKLTLSLSEIQINLRRVGISRRYKGFERLSYAVFLVLENDKRLEAVVKEVYMPVGEKCGCSWGAVERSLRLISNSIWYEHFEEIYKVTGIRMKRPPTPAELLDIFAVYLKLLKNS